MSFDIAQLEAAFAKMPPTADAYVTSEVRKGCESFLRGVADFGVRAAFTRAFTHVVVPPLADDVLDRILGVFSDMSSHVFAANRDVTRGNAEIAFRRLLTGLPVVRIGTIRYCEKHVLGVDESEASSGDVGLYLMARLTILQDLLSGDDVPDLVDMRLATVGTTPTVVRVP